MKTAVLLIAAIATIACGAPTSANAAQPDSVAEYVRAARLSYGSCRATFALAYSLARFRQVAGTTSPDGKVLDLTEAKQCLSEQGKETGKAYEAAIKAAGKNPQALAAMKRLQSLWKTEMANIVLTSSEAGDENENRAKKANSALKAAGSEVILRACKDDFDCVNRMNEYVQDLDLVL